MYLCIQLVRICIDRVVLFELKRIITRSRKISNVTHAYGTTADKFNSVQLTGRRNTHTHTYKSIILFGFGNKISSAIKPQCIECVDDVKSGGCVIVPPRCINAF